MLRHSIKIERKATTPDGAGGEALTWVVVLSLKAMVTPLSGNERLHAQRLEASTTHKILTRYFTDVRAADRINFNGRFFNIEAILNMEERNLWYEFRAVEGVAQ